MRPQKNTLPESPDESFEMISYVSLANGTPSEIDLERMLKEARARNRKHKITGSLLYRDGTYLQVFEGPAKATAELYQNILSDDRHHEVVTLFRRPTQKRYFRDWTMAYRPLSSKELKNAQDYVGSIQHEAADPTDVTGEILTWVKSLVSEFQPRSA